MHPVYIVVPFIMIAMADGLATALAAVSKRKENVELWKHGANFWHHLFVPEDLTEAGKKLRAVSCSCVVVSIVVIVVFLFFFGERNW